MRYTMKILGLILLLLSATASSAANLSATYVAVPQADNTVMLDVTVINEGVDTVYSAILSLAGSLEGASTAAFAVGTLTPGATSNFQVNVTNNPGYMFMKGTGLDGMSNAIEFEVVGEAL